MHVIECDGSLDCRASEHIDGCFSGMHRRKDVLRLPLLEECERLRAQLAGAVDLLARIVNQHDQRLDRTRADQPTLDLLSEARELLGLHGGKGTP